MENCVIMWAGEGKKIDDSRFWVTGQCLENWFFFSFTYYVLLFLKYSQAVVYVNVIWGKLNFFLQEFSWIINAFENQI